MIFPRFVEKEGIKLNFQLEFSHLYQRVETLAPPIFNPTGISMTSKLCLHRSEGYTVNAVIFAGTTYR